MRKTRCKVFFKAGKMLCLILAALLSIRAMPLSFALASVSSSESPVEATDEAESSIPEVMSEPEPPTEHITSPEPEAATQSLEATHTPSLMTEASAEPTTTPEEMTYTNSISGMLWVDMFDDTDNSIYAGDGICQPEEEPLAGYIVYLYKANDTSATVQVAETDENGRYEFTDLEPESYIVGVSTATMGGIEYLLPFFYLDGTEEDNRFVAAYDADEDAYLYAYTAPIVVDADTAITDVNAGMRTPSEIRPTALIPWVTNEVIVETEADFRTALGNSAYTTIYLGADITMLTSTRATVAARTGTLVINGTDPRDGTQYTYTDYASAAAYETLTGPCSNITFKDITVYINTSYGIYDATVSGETVTFDGVTGQAAQFYLGYGAASILVIKDSELTLRKTHTYTQELVENVGTVRFEGMVSVTRLMDSTAVSKWDEIFYLTGSNSTVQIADGANVTLDNNVTTGEHGGGAIFYTVGRFVVGDDASFTCYSTTGFGNIDSDGLLDSVTIGARADVRFICTTSHYWGTGTRNSALRGTNFTAGAGSNFLLYNTTTNTEGGAFRFTNVTLNNPESFVIMNPSAAAIGTNTSNLTATDVSSIRYYPSSAISGLFDTGSYAYMPTANYSKLWVQSTPFNVSTTGSWTNASPAITTNYSNRSATAAEASIASTNFSARTTVYGIEIRGSSYMVSGTVSGLPDNSNLTITYTIDNGAEQTVTTDSGGNYTIPGVPYSAKGVITPPAVPTHYTLSPTGITLESVTAASTGNDFSYTLISYTVTEKYVDSSTGTSLQPDTSTSVSVNSSYSYGGSLANITDSIGNIYVYQGYKVGSYTPGAGGTLGPFDGSGSPTISSITENSTVYLVYTSASVKMTVSKTATGAYADTTKTFTFTIYFADSIGTPLASGTQFAYAGGIITSSGAAAPANGTLTLDGEGKATFMLKHGQTITIADVAASGKVRIEEADYSSNYSITFIDSEVGASEPGADTDLRGMTLSDRTFDFINARIVVVPGGIVADSGGMILLVLLAVLALSTSLAITVARRARAR